MQIEKYLMEKHGFFKKMLEITLEQNKALEKKDLEQFKFYVGEISKIVIQIKELDKGFEAGQAAWNSGKGRAAPDRREKIRHLSGEMEKTIEKIMQLQPDQMKQLTAEQKLLEKEILTFRRERKAVGSYETSQEGARLLDIKK